jgi:hypothetical protein
MLMDEAILQQAKKALEEEIELSNVTDLRQELLPIIERIQKNPALRLLILKHGRPQAVLMSTQTFEVLKKVVTSVVEKTDKMGPTENIEAAFGRLLDERPSMAQIASVATGGSPVSQQQKVVKEIIGEIQDKLRSLDNVLLKDKVAG